ncbi:hypothetical protein RV134_210030 [Roseovarius sp. EC-HK134]|uniref:hypothetical protein n=1 Tax=unclassified Roseovarius TaxID=2614913 RepID=UPI0012544F91|nr:MULTISPECIES: hypothetical protein [unclassified Roseovarius]VVS99809.1 hypothetical protein RV134_210030 [Roseovarius sp. EC-HK134]VVT00496.1 hypothetical protein RV420_240030 [Roseovarius sp. EC-SD190]
MTKSKMANRYSPEVRARAVRMVFEHLLGPIGNIPPAEAEENFYAQRDVLDMVA